MNTVEKISQEQANCRINRDWSTPNESNTFLMLVFSYYLFYKNNLLIKL